MTWNPELYNQYKDIRNEPFYDLRDLIAPDEYVNGIDLGCGTGEQTAILKDWLPKSTLLGIDSSKEMLATSSIYQSPGLRFKLQDIRDVLKAGDRYDLVFSNAALQWIDDHQVLIPQILNLLTPGGQFAVQMPVQHENLLNRILISLAGEAPYASIFAEFKRESPVLSIDQYAQLLFDGGLKDLHISIKMYPMVANSSSELYNFIAGSALQPYLDRLPNDVRDRFIDEFRFRIQKSFASYPAIYAFKRLLIYGRRAQDS